ncbi:MAG: lamin tail domain-containing protein, partial [Planctomycetota bacterium]|nr:lamin tail domain-containing protein [Planctomycetota bacterium]
MLLFRRHRIPTPALFLALSLATGGLVASDFDVVLNEIHYHPLGNQNADEYIELFNRGGAEVDLSGWALLEGVRFVFPPDTRLGPKEFLLVSSNPAHTRNRYGVDAVVGPYSGRLDNGGEILSLVNSQGDVVGRLHYGDGGIWSALADGLGPSLELIDPRGQTDLPRSWRPSVVVDGTPGAPNSRSREEPDVVEETVIVGDAEVWRYLKGMEAFPDGWQDVGFADADWDAGPTGIGYGDDDDRTLLEDMGGAYIAFAARKRFFLSQADLQSAGEILLSVDYDDGFVAYLNGQEVARANLGN